MTAPSADRLALAGLRVVEYGSLVSAPYAAKMLADMGADVIKVEPPSGDPARGRGPFPRGMESDPNASGLFLYLNANKRGVVLDLDDSSGHEAFDALLRAADVFIHNTPPAEAGGLDPVAMAERYPRLVHTWITPFGLSGPYAGYRGENLNLVAGGGWASITPGNNPDLELAPLKAFGLQADFQAGAHAGLATMGGLFARRLNGRGQLIEVSAQECVAAQLEMAFVFYTHNQLIPSRAGIRSSAPIEIMQCKDGLIFVMTADPHQWTALVHMLEDPEWASWPIFEDRFVRAQNRDVLRPLIEDWLTDHTVQEVFDMAAQYRLPFAPVSTMGDLIDSPQNKARGFFVTMRDPHAGEVTMPGAPTKLSETPWTLRTPPPRLGQHTAEVLAELQAVRG